MSLRHSCPSWAQKGDRRLQHHRTFIAKPDGSALDDEKLPTSLHAVSVAMEHASLYGTTALQAHSAWEASFSSQNGLLIINTLDRCNSEAPHHGRSKQQDRFLSTVKQSQYKHRHGASLTGARMFSRPNAAWKSLFEKLLGNCKAEHPPHRQGPGGTQSIARHSFSAAILVSI